MRPRKVVLFLEYINLHKPIAMKKLYLFLVPAFFVLFSCNQKAADPMAEKDAIKAVIEKEFSAYINQDLVKLLETVIQDENTIRISIGQKGYQERLAWDNVYPYYKKSVQTDWSDFEDIKVDRSNYNFIVCDESAYVLFDQSINYSYKGEVQESLSKETRMLRKMKGEWKIQVVQFVDLSSFENKTEKAF